MKFCHITGMKCYYENTCSEYNICFPFDPDPIKIIKVKPMPRKLTVTAEQLEKHREFIEHYLKGGEIQFKSTSFQDPTWEDFNFGKHGEMLVDMEFRKKPVMSEYRVLKSKCGTYSVDSHAEAERYSAMSDFVCWLTDWIEYEA